MTDKEIGEMLRQYFLRWMAMHGLTAADVQRLTRKKVPAPRISEMEGGRAARLAWLIRAGESRGETPGAVLQALANFWLGWAKSTAPEPPKAPEPDQTIYLDDASQDAASKRTARRGADQHGRARKRQPRTKTGR